MLRQVLLLALIMAVPLNGWRMAKHTAWFLLSIYVAFQVRFAAATCMSPPGAHCSCLARTRATYSCHTYAYSALLTHVR